MRGERRHELKQNELADWINNAIEKVKPYSKTALAVVTVAVVVFAVVAWWRRQSAAQEAGAWDNLYARMDSGQAAELERLAEQYSGSDVAGWAAVSAGDMYLSAGCRELFTNKASASQELQKAVNSYLTVLNEDHPPQVMERATFGLARAYESLAGTRQGQGELSKAIEQYGKLIKSWPDGVYADMAAERLEDLKRHETKEFYDAFAKFDPKPAFTDDQMGQGLSFGNAPDEGEIPDLLGGMGLDDSSADQSEPDGSSQPEAPSDDPGAEDGGDAPPANEPMESTAEDSTDEVEDATQPPEPAQTPSEPQEPKAEGQQSAPPSESSKSEPPKDDTSPATETPASDSAPASEDGKAATEQDS
jgi:hypothetical protein